MISFLRRAGLGRSSHGELLASQNSSFSTGFIRFLDMAECHVVYSEKPNAFLIISGALLRFDSKMIKIQQGL